MKIHTIDASGKKLGRVASEAASFIMGKHLVSFKRNEIPLVTVIIENASKADLPERKLSAMTHERYSGYAGGRKVLSAKQVSAKKGHRELFKIAVHGMLPANKLRARMIKRLIVKE